MKLVVLLLERGGLPFAEHHRDMAFELISRSCVRHGLPVFGHRLGRGFPGPRTTLLPVPSHFGSSARSWGPHVHDDACHRGVLASTSHHGLVGHAGALGWGHSCSQKMPVRHCGCAAPCVWSMSLGSTCLLPWLWAGADLSMCPIGVYMCHRGRLGWSGASGLRQNRGTGTR